MEKHYMKDMTLAELSKMIAKDWNDISPRAELCLSAMQQLNGVKDHSGKIIVINFLCSAVSWRGNLARMIKKELNRRLTWR